MRSPKDRPDRRCVWTPLHGEHLFVGMTTPRGLPPSPPWMTVGPRGRVSFRWLGGLRGVGWLGWARPGPRSVWTGGLSVLAGQPVVRRTRAAVWVLSAAAWARISPVTQTSSPG